MSDIVTVTTIRDRDAARALCDAGDAALRAAAGTVRFEHLGEAFDAVSVCGGTGVEITDHAGKIIARRVRQ